MLTQQKKDTVLHLSDKLARTKALFVTEYQGMTHAQLSTLRKSLKKAESEFIVAKNTLMKVAMKQSKDTIKLTNEQAEELDKAYANPTATLLAYGDPIAAVKALAVFIKNTQLPKVKIGFFEGKVASVSEFTKLSNLPTRDILIATMLMRMKSPIYGLHRALSWNMQRLVVALNAVKEKKGATS